jgi:phosphoribosylpyrophosphate synthetase
VFLIQPTCPPVNDHLMELMVMIDACKRASARSITAVSKQTTEVVNAQRQYLLVQLV